MSSTKDHQDLVNHILETYGARPGWRIWKANTGVGRSFDMKRVIKYGLVGSADISGIVFGSGRRLEIECKTGNAVQSKEQRAFGEMIRGGGGIHVVIRSAHEAALFFENLKP